MFHDFLSHFKVESADSFPHLFDPTVNPIKEKQQNKGQASCQSLHDLTHPEARINMKGGRILVFLDHLKQL